MLKLTIPAHEFWDDASQSFVYTKETVLSLEHSLISVSKWESIWHRPFLTDEKRTYAETISYIKCMTITQNVDPIIYTLISNEHITQVLDYISDRMTATWFGGSDESKSTPVKKEIITSELIYYWMSVFNLPSDYEKWHLNRLLTLIRICKIKRDEENNGGKKNAKDSMKSNASLMAARRAKLKKH